MPHFSNDLRTKDPESLRRLRTLLHGPATLPRRLPSLADRFGVDPRDDRDLAPAGSGRLPAPYSHLRRRLPTN
jgi:hypothetical protein